MFSLFKRNPYRAQAARLYDHLVSVAREPLFYAEYGVPDTLEGRFDCLTLHVFAVMNRLKAEGARPAEAAALSQALFDAMFKVMDISFREAGVGDLSVPKKMKAMMTAFNGRCHAYAEGLGAGGASLEAVVARNLYGTCAQPDPKWVRAMTLYLQTICTDLSRMSLDQIRDDDFEFMCAGGRHEKIA